ncbi:MAG: hypothetical protein LBR37_00595 [Erysipelotrichaceae bacterium]|nr:hypothetical protein [Erysipelotrichaceae bacterium]
MSKLLKSKLIIPCVLIGTLLFSCVSKDYDLVYQPNIDKTYFGYNAPIENDFYERKADFRTLSYFDNNNVSRSIDFYGDVVKSHAETRPYQMDNVMSATLVSKNFYTEALTKVPSQKILVIPVDFTNYSADKLLYSKEETRVLLQNVFFGHPRTTSWESVASFFNKSSLGNLRISGEVAPWFTYQEPQELVASWDSKHKSEQILLAALEWLETNKLVNLKDYDQDRDGFIDSIFLILANDSALIKNTNPFWAFQNHYEFPSYDAFLIDNPRYLEELQDNDPLTNNLIIDKPWPSTYASASFSFLNLKTKKDLPDVRTIIHEVSHLFGLPDLYHVGGHHSPTGKGDMMDFNIGDHNAYSKMLLDWIRPITVKQATTISLSPTTTSGDFILLANNWNGTPYDEYLLLEFYAPNDLNSQASSEPLNYTSSNGITSTYQLPNTPGIKLSYIDSRLAYYVANDENYIHRSFSFVDFIGTTVIPTPHRIELYNNNSYRNGVPLMKILDRSLGMNDRKAPDYNFENNSLFVEGNTFNEVFSEFRFLDGSKCPFDFKIVKLSNTKVTIEFIVNE